MPPEHEAQVANDAPVPQPPPRRRPQPRPNTFAVPALDGDRADPVTAVANRGLRDDNNALVEPDATLDLVDATARVITGGPGLDDPMSEQLAQRLKNRDEKKWVVECLIQDDDIRRAAEFLRVRRRSESYLLRMFNRGALNVGDAMLFSRLAEQHIKDIRASLTPAKTDQDKTKFTETVVEKLELRDGTKATRKVQRTIETTLEEGTTPQGREIIRRKLYGIKKKMDELKAQRATEAEPVA